MASAPALRAFAEALVSEGHPLAVLPLRLLPAERGLRRPPGAAADLTWAVPPASLGRFVEPELLAAWRSLAGLTGVPADTPPAETAELVARTHWFRLAPVSDWFHGVAWDLAVAALRPGGQEIAVLTATDTD
ncbi:MULTISPECIES: DUF6183 family protein [unclassified Streptomyces]|uniref:DUF6183 family protein n=1 Tax=unclassified Streptomyces TaxID=2593676 RepID=UPI00341399CF